MNKKFYFRCDGSNLIGIGHIMRCLTLANLLDKKGYDSCFITSSSMKKNFDLLNTSSHEIIFLPDYKFTKNFDRIRCLKNKEYTDFEKSDLEQMKNISSRIYKDSIVIIDHYLLGSYWQLKIRSIFKKVIVIDDLFDSDHCCDLIIDSNIRDPLESKKLHSRYKKIPILTGDKFLIIRNRFRKSRSKILKSLNVEKDSIDCLVMFGGTGMGNHIYSAINSICSLPYKINSHVVIGEKNKYFSKIKKLSKKSKNIQLYNFTENIHLIMDKCDVAIGALGLITWERCYLGLPALVFVRNFNQSGLLKYLVSKNIVFDLGDNISVDKLIEGLKHFKLFNQNRIKIRKDLMKIIDGKGSGRIINEMINLYG